MKALHSFPHQNSRRTLNLYQVLIGKWSMRYTFEFWQLSLRQARVFPAKLSGQGNYKSCFSLYSKQCRRRHDKPQHRLAGRPVAL